jgi:hypothetical protein
MASATAMSFRQPSKWRLARDGELAVLKMNCEQIHSGDAAPTEEYALLAGPVPAVA